MIVVPATTLRHLMTQIVEAAHGLSDENGEPHILSTLDASQLRVAALTALVIATGQMIWPGDQTIKIKRPRVRQGIFQEDG